MPTFTYLKTALKAISKFSRITSVIYPKHYSNQTCDYWLIKPNQQTLYIQATLILFNCEHLQINEQTITK